MFDINLIVGGKRQPSQKRALITVERITRSARQLLEKSDYQRITTNHIAEHANVAISSLYQYFPDKQSIFLTLYNRVLVNTLAELTTLIARVEKMSFDEAFPYLIDQWLNVFENERMVLLEMPEQYPELNVTEHFPSLSSLLYEAGRDFLGDKTKNIKGCPNEMAIFLLHKVNFSAIRSYILHDSKEIDRSIFIKELSALSSIYLQNQLRPATG